MAVARWLRPFTSSPRARLRRPPYGPAGLRGLALSYGLAVAASALALAVALMLDPESQAKPFAEFLAAVAVAAWYGGFGPGIVAALLGALAIAYFFDQPYGSFMVSRPDAVFDLALMLAVATLISWLNGSLRIARKRAEAGWAEAQASARRASIAREDAEQLAMERAAVLAHIADGVIVVAEAGPVRFMNEAARRLLAGSGPEHPALNLAELTRGGQPVFDREVRLNTDRGQVVVLCTAVPLQTASGTPSGSVVSLRDVTTERGLARQKEEFFANASHDLRTPVATIKASIDVVLENLPEGFPEPLTGLLENIEREADRMTSFVNDLLELTRLRAGQVQLQRVPCDIVEIARGAVRAIEPLALRRQQRIVLNVPEHDVPAVVDPTLIERALLNLLSNAQKYGRSGGTIELRVHNGPSHLTLAVCDDGPGIAPADQARVFERFFRASTEATRRVQGSGLGLPIARAMVELHNGHLTVESALGQGSAFRIDLPGYSPDYV